MKDWINRLLLSCLFLLGSYESKATHIFGADLHYTYVSSGVYTIVLDVYGDCSGGSFPSLISSNPVIDIYQGSALVDTLHLNLVGGAVEVTPVCAAQAGNTTCNGGTIQGIKKFTYQKNYALTGTFSNIRFRFNGTMGSGTQAGRSNSITNISGTSVMNLEATLNNTGGPNSSVSYTTIPTPFFCINKPAQYNPGAVDPNGDSLSFALVAGLVSGGTVNYVNPYTATAPLATQAGTFSTSSASGQVNFTPNQLQNSLVVSKVSEYKNGVLVGTSMREMTFVVLSNCNNNPPIGSISNVNGGTLSINNTVLACQGQSTFTFNINPTDIDGDSITVTTAGVPAGAIISISGNNTATPSLNFSWNINTVLAGNYLFYVTFQDNGCPLSSKQTIAYTVSVLPKPTLIYSLVQGATCVGKAEYSLYTVGTNPINVIVNQGSTVLQTINNIGTNYADSLSPGIYTFIATDVMGCSKNLSVTITNPPTINATYSITPLACFGINTGAITSVISTGQAPYQYALGTGAYSGNATFSGLAAGTYVYKIKDANYCTKDTTLVVQSPTQLKPTIISLSNATCYGMNNGSITLNGIGGTPVYSYAINGGSFSSANTFNGLNAGSYILTIQDVNNCTHDTSLIIQSPTQIVPLVISKNNPLCFGAANGSITMNAAGGVSPYRYAVNGGSFSTFNTLNNLSAGSQIITVKDTNNCTHDTTVNLLSPPILVPVVQSITEPLCNGTNNGVITMNASGGAPTYRYAINSGAFSSINSFSGLSAGNYLISIKDTNNCTHDTTISVNQPNIVYPVITNITQPLCYGQSNGSITMNGTGGTSPYTYALASGIFGANNTFTGIASGSIVLHVKDNHNCVHDTTITMTEPSPLQVICTSFETKCFGDANGFVIVAGNGGTSGYNYAVNSSAFQINDTLKNLNAGNHIVTVKDANGCTKDTTITINQPPVLEIASFQINHPTCEGFTDGSISITGNGGTNPYQYQLNNGGFGINNLFQILGVGNYLVTIQDAHGCLKDTSVSLVGYPPLYFDSVAIKPATCFGIDDGTLTVFASGGNPPFRYATNNGIPSLSNFFSNLASINYTVQIIDDKGCVKDTAVYIPSPKVMDMNMVVRNNDCIGADDQGAIQVQINGGTFPYTYLWSTSATADSIFGLSNGNYFVVVTDAKGCEDTAFAEVKYDDCCTVFVPTAFTPNGDGRNDGISVLFKGDMELKEFSIYNRFGQRVFCGKNVNDRWDGTFNGEAQELGTYFYYIRALCGYQQNVEKQFKGDIILVR